MPGQYGHLYKAKNRENARKTRNRKKGYIDSLKEAMVLMSEDADLELQRRKELMHDILDTVIYIYVDYNMYVHTS